MTETTFRLASTAFHEGGEIPTRFTCDDEDVSPDLTWEGAPPTPGRWPSIVDDPDARGWVHWVVFDMTGTSSGGLAEGISTSPDAPPQGTNDFGRRRLGRAVPAVGGASLRVPAASPSTGRSDSPARRVPPRCSRRPRVTSSARRA